MIGYRLLRLYVDYCDWVLIVLFHRLKEQPVYTISCYSQGSSPKSVKTWFLLLQILPPITFTFSLLKCLCVWCFVHKAASLLVQTSCKLPLPTDGAWENVANTLFFWNFHHFSFQKAGNSQRARVWHHHHDYQDTNRLRHSQNRLKRFKTKICES